MKKIILFIAAVILSMAIGFLMNKDPEPEDKLAVLKQWHMSQVGADYQIWNLVKGDGK